MFAELATFLTSKAFLAFTSAATLCGLILTLVSLRLALKSITDGKTIVANSARVLKGLKDVGDSLTTHRVGELPYCVDIITALVASAQRTLQITTVFPAVGIFSAPEGSAKLAHAIQLQADKLSIDLLFASRAARMEFITTQYAAAFADWPAWSSAPENTTRLVLFAKHYHHTSRSFATAHEFAEFGLAVDEKIVRDVYWAATNIETTDAFIPVISWIKDDDEAFFAIANNRGYATGFITRDLNIIQSLKSVRDRYPRCAPPAVGLAGPATLPAAAAAPLDESNAYDPLLLEPASQLPGNLHRSPP